jgi:hypothetical protein
MCWEGVVGDEQAKGEEAKKGMYREPGMIRVTKILRKEMHNYVCTYPHTFAIASSIITYSGLFVIMIAPTSPLCKPYIDTYMHTANEGFIGQT